MEERDIGDPPGSLWVSTGVRYVELSPGRVELREGPSAETPPGSVKVRVDACGICGTDLHMLRGMQLPRGIDYPVRPGHEVAGTVLELGQGVDDLSVGEQVVLHIYDPCESCEACVSGHENRCSRARVLGIHAPGGLADEIVWPASRVVSTEGIPAVEAALLPDAVASAYHALTLAVPAEGTGLCVIGAGGVGTHVLQLAELLHPSVRLAAVVRSEASAERLAKTGIFAVAGIEGSARRVREELGPLAAVIDFSGATEAPTEALAMLTIGGRLVLGSVVDEPLAFATPATAVTVREIQIVGSYGSTLNELRSVCRLAAGGGLDLAASASHRMPLSRVGEAFEILENKPSGLVRMVVEPGERGD